MAFSFFTKSKFNITITTSFFNHLPLEKGSMMPVLSPEPQGRQEFQTEVSDRKEAHQEQAV